MSVFPFATLSFEVTLDLIQYPVLLCFGNKLFHQIRLSQQYLPLADIEGNPSLKHKSPTSPPLPFFLVYTVFFLPKSLCEVTHLKNYFSLHMVICAVPFL